MMSISKNFHAVVSFFLFITYSCSAAPITPPIPPVQESYSLGRVGNTDDIESETESGLVLMGGSTDVDAAMRWMIERSGGGDFVIIRVSGGAGYNDYLYGMGGLNSVETLRLNTAEASNNEKVFEILKNAEALFIAGGDQSQYLRLWEGTKVEEAIQYLIHEKQIPIGGTSAGCAIMGEFVYTGEKGSIISQEALQNPYDERLTVRRSSLINHPFLQNTITDQHFSQRNREGRLVGFLARLKSLSENLPLKAIAVDEKTAVAIDKDGQAKVFGQANAFYLVESNADQLPETLQIQTPLTWNLGQQALKYKTVNADQNPSLDLKTWGWEWDGFWFVEAGVLKNN
ncbi:cyanophycinase [Aquiflexum sp.]|uniref:cyanophycinase n=1 Tax=Aquiflexum sp. TaxID=1872584 RepID=UPI003592FB83